MTTPFNSHQLKEMADNMEAIRFDKLRYYNAATSSTKDARRSLFAVIRNDYKR
jgi:hypothetical protein